MPAELFCLLVDSTANSVHHFRVPNTPTLSPTLSLDRSIDTCTSCVLHTTWDQEIDSTKTKEGLPLLLIQQILRNLLRLFPGRVVALDQQLVRDEPLDWAE